MKFAFADGEAALAAAKALEVQVPKRNNKKRSSSKIIVKGKNITITVKAADTVALRACVNNYLRLIQGIECVLNIEK